MRYSKYYIPTLREAPSDAEVPSQQFAVRGGYIKKIATGIYDCLPLGLKVIRKVENIVRQEMNRAGALEVSMPTVVPAELWQKSGRWYMYGKELLRFKDRAEREYCLGPTHEEVIVDMVTNSVKSYKQLPLNLYQIQTKFRDEIRPRFGLMRAREFTMKDAYSFHDSQLSLDQTYLEMHEAYSRIFNRCGLDFRVVKADSGNIGGNASQEFMITADTGEDAILFCNDCDYAANSEKATTLVLNESEEELALLEVHTPEKKSIEEVAQFLQVDSAKTIKALVYKYLDIKDQTDADWLYAVVFIRGDYELNEVKLGNALSAKVLMLAQDDEIARVTKAPVGYIGPVGLDIKNVRVLADDSIVGLKNAVIGANMTDYHIKNFNHPRDFQFSEITDLKTAKHGDICPECQKGNLSKERGIEVGHIFKLGKKYSAAMQATYLDTDGKEQVFIMGCYGIGIGRTAMSAIEQSHDERGPIWPIQIAPFEVIIIPANLEVEEQRSICEQLYSDLLANNIDVLFDDRKERIGVKFNDADLIGAPIRVVLGKKLAEGLAELNYRNGQKEDVKIAGLTTYLCNIVKELKSVNSES